MDIPPSAKPRQPRYARSKQPPKMVLTERDFELVELTFKYRFLFTSQYHWLFPTASKVNLKNRLNLLFQHGYLERIKIPVTSTADPTVYALREKGAELLAVRRGVERKEVRWDRYLNRVSPTHVQHLLGVNDVLISFRVALEQAKADGRLADFRLYRGQPDKHRLTVIQRDPLGHRKEASVIPDAVMLLQGEGQEPVAFFIEVDRGTEAGPVWQEKITIYRDYIHSDQLLQAWRSHSAIVLTVTTGKRRLRSLAQRTLAAGGRKGYWFTVVSEIKPETCLAEIWTPATECAAGAAGTQQFTLFSAPFR